MESIPSSECISGAVGQGMCHFFWGHKLQVLLLQETSFAF